MHENTYIVDNPIDYRQKKTIVT